MSCEACWESLETDGETPACETEKGCMVSSLSERGREILELRAKLITLNGLVDSGTILRMYGADIDDIELLAFVEEEIKKLELKEEDG